MDKHRVCRVCGCTDLDCSQCIEAQGYPCHWVENDLCSRCAQDPGRTLGDALPKEQARVREILGAYREIGPAGAFGAALIEHALRRADMAVMSGDVAAMIRSYNELREIK